MNPDDVGNFLSRWSRRKLGKEQPAADAQQDAAEQAAPAAQLPEAVPAAPPEPLPPVESLTPESDFTPFMRPDVAPDIKQAAMKQLFKDPHFNVMDGLDTYIDDYSIESPIPAGVLNTMYQARQLLFSEEEKAAADAKDAADAKAAADAAEQSKAAEAENIAAPEQSPPTAQKA